MTPAQLTTFKAAIQADANITALVTAGATGAIANYYNTAASPAYYVWQTSVPTQTIYDAIGWSKLTPVDTPDGTATYTNRALCCQGKQFNLQTILQGRESINATKTNIRSGLQDALTAVPSGVSGATQGAGWAAVQTAMSRAATNAEKLFATGVGTQASPSLMSFEGNVQDYDVVQALYQ